MFVIFVYVDNDMNIKGRGDVVPKPTENFYGLETSYRLEIKHDLMLSFASSIQKIVDCNWKIYIIFYINLFNYIYIHR